MKLGLSVLVNRDTGPIVRAKRRSGQPCLIVEIAYGIIGPGVAHCQWTPYVFAPNDDRVAFNTCLGPNEFVIGSSNCEAFWWSTIGGFQSTAEVLELNANLVVLY